MAVWKFQLLPHQPGIVSKGYRMDAAGESVQAEVNDALPYRFRFHKIAKIVLALGEGSLHDKLYEELLGVAIKVVPEFDLHAYKDLPADERVERLRETVLSQFEWFQDHFEDAAFIAKAREKLVWAA